MTTKTFTFLLSWSGIFVVLGPGAFTTGGTAPTEGLLPLVYLAMFAAPAVAHRCSDRTGQQRTAFPATAPEATGVKEAVHGEDVGRRMRNDGHH